MKIPAAVGVIDAPPGWSPVKAAGHRPCINLRKDVQAQLGTITGSADDDRYSAGNMHHDHKLVGLLKTPAADHANGATARVEPGDRDGGLGGVSTLRKIFKRGGIFPCLGARRRWHRLTP